MPLNMDQLSMIFGAVLFVAQKLWADKGRNDVPGDQYYRPGKLCWTQNVKYAFMELAATKSLQLSKSCLATFFYLCSVTQTKAFDKSFIATVVV